MIFGGRFKKFTELFIQSSVLLFTFLQVRRTIEESIKVPGGDVIFKYADKPRYASYQHIIWKQWAREI